MDTLKKWWPTLLASVAAVWGVMGSQVVNWITAHPKYSLAVAVASTIASHLAPSPLRKPD